MGEHAGGVPGRKGSYERRGAGELDAALVCGFGPGELSGVPSDKSLGLCGDEEILVEAGVRLAAFAAKVLRLASSLKFKEVLSA